MNGEKGHAKTIEYRFHASKSPQSKELKERVYRAMRNDYATGAVGYVKYRKEYIPDIDKGSPRGLLFVSFNCLIVQGMIIPEILNLIS